MLLLPDFQGQEVRARISQLPLDWLDVEVKEEETEQVEVEEHGGMWESDNCEREVCEDKIALNGKDSLNLKTEDGPNNENQIISDKSQKDLDKKHNKYNSVAQLKAQTKNVHKDRVVAKATCDYSEKSLYNKGRYKAQNDTRLDHKADGTGEQEMLRRKGINLKGHERSKLYCSICDTTYPTPLDYSKHKETHRDGEVWKCQEQKCLKKFKRHNLLVIHMQRHRGEFNHNCIMCGKQFVTSHSYHIHMKSHRREYSYSCKECQKKFVTEVSYRIHMNTHRPPSLGCDHCGSMYSDKEKLKEHMKRHEATEHSDGTAKEFLGKHAKMKHVRRCQKESTKCDICAKRFKNLKNLKVHLLNIHDGVRHFCDQCGSSFSVKQNLLNHIRDKHSDPAMRTLQSKCKECGKDFARPYNLCKNHQFKDKEQKLTCDRCGFITNRAQQLRHHQVSSRCDPSKALVRKFHCTQCGRGFTTEKALHKHEKDYHLVGKPYKCDMCGVRFTQSWGVTKHQRKGHCKYRGKPQAEQQCFLEHGQWSRHGETFVTE